MLGWLGRIVTVLVDLPIYITIGLVKVINLLIAALGAALAVVLSLFPGMPSVPSWGNDDSWLGWLNFFVPVGGLLSALVVFVTLWIAFLVIRVIAKWVKAL